MLGITEQYSLAQLLFVSSQNLYDLDEDDDIVVPVPPKQMKFAATGSLVHHMVCRFFSFSCCIRLSGRMGEVVDRPLINLGYKLFRAVTSQLLDLTLLILGCQGPMQ